MAFIPTTDVVKAYYTVNSGSLNKSWGSTLWFRKVDFSEADMTSLANALVSWYETELMPNLYTGVVSDDVTVWDMTSETGPVVNVDANSTAGSISGSLGGINQCVVITFRTSARGKTGIGRNYVSGFIQGELEGDSVSNSRVNAVLLAYGDLDSYVSGLGWEHVVVSFQENNVPRTNGLARTVTGYSARSVLYGSQDRRVDRP